MSDIEDDVIDEVVGEFLIESREALDQLDQDVVALEDHPEPETLAAVFRALHTIKGTCGFLDFGHLETVTHEAENLLVVLRDGEREISREVISALLGTLDAVREMLDAIEATGCDGDRDHATLVGELVRLQDTDTPPPVPRLGELLVQKALVTEADIELAIAQQSLGDTRPMGEILVDLGVIAPDELEEILSVQSERRGVAMPRSTIRVEVQVLDDLMGLVGDLADLRQELAAAAAPHGGELAALAARLDVLVSDLDRSVTRSRMQPVGTLWNKLPRVVRDLALSVGKQVQIERDGADTEIDKTVLEAIKDPLTHLVRNAVDHGIEDPATRVAAGKPPEGRLTLRARREPEQIVIELADDGAGIDPFKVRDKAVARGLLTEAQAAQLSDVESQHLVFLPGLSTATEVTNVSGRGVGMDVVKTNIDRIGGTVDVSSQPGAGTTIRIGVPLGPVPEGG